MTKNNLIGKIQKNEVMMREHCRKENAPFPKIDFTGSYFYIVFEPTKDYLEMTKDEKVVRINGKTADNIANN